MDMITSIQSSTSGWFNQGGPSVDMITSTQSSTSGWFSQGGPSVDMITPIQSSTSGWFSQGGPSVDMIFNNIIVTQRINDGLVEREKVFSKLISTVN